MDIKTINAQEMFHKYDELVSITLHNLYILSKDKESICLNNFDRKNPEHLYLFRIALMARDIYNKPVKVSASWWDVFCLNWKIRKNFNKIKRDKTKYYDIDTQAILDFIRPNGIEYFGKNFTFENIYKQYYEGSLT